jgi:Zn-dependent M28 family amino/carboxypeptidase
MTSPLRDHVEFLARHPRPPASAWHARARDYIRQRLHDAGFHVVEDSAQVAGLPMINIHAEPAAARHADLPLVIVGAHYDSIPGCPGADDNASAVATLLEVARELAPRLQRDAGNLTARLHLVAYDLEESGLLGSWHHAQALRQRRAAVRGMISLEMLAYTDHRPKSQHLPPALAGRYPDVGNFIGVVGDEASRELFETAVAGLKSVAGLPVEGLLAPGAGRLLPESRLSDHSSFWDAGYPALMVTDTSFYRNPHYHQASDTPETLDYPFLEKVTAGICGGVWRALQ